MKKLIVESWWVTLFLIITYVLYSQSIQKKQGEIAQMQAKVWQLEHEKKELTLNRNDLVLQVESQKDPVWIELTLMKVLGLVPEGQTKVYFEKE